MRAVVDGRVAATPIEWALVALARASVETPAHLAPSDLAPLRGLVGDGALDYALVLAAFHFINRMADLLLVDEELPGLPWLRRIEPVRRGVVRVMSALLGRMDLGNRRYARTFEEAVGLMPAGTDPAALAPLRARPHVVEAIALAIQERDARSTLDRAMLSRVHAVVETALPACADDARGLDARPVDPIDAFAFVGTRHPQRTTGAMIDALRARGLDDLAILDLATAVADANQWARLRRVVGLPAALFAPSAV